MKKGWLAPLLAMLCAAPIWAEEPDWRAIQACNSFLSGLLIEDIQSPRLLYDHRALSEMHEAYHILLMDGVESGALSNDEALAISNDAADIFRAARGMVVSLRNGTQVEETRAAIDQGLLYCENLHLRIHP